MTELSEAAKSEIVHQYSKGDIFSRMVLVCSGITASFGILGLIGWMSGMHTLASFGSSYIPISPVVALAFILLGGTWFLYAQTPSYRFGKICVLASILFVSLIVLLNLIQFLTGVHTGIEEVLVRNVLALDPQTYGAGPMSPIVAASFLLVCIAMILLIPVRRLAGLSAILAFVVVSVNIVILLGYLYGTPLLYGGEIRPVALPAGLAFVILGIGLIIAAGPDHFPLRVLVGPSVRALLLRTFLLVIFVVALTDGIVYNHL